MVRHSLRCALLAALLVGVVGCGERSIATGDAGADVMVARDLRLPSDRGAQDFGRPDLQAPDAGLVFPAVLEGVWLIGWSGGANHFSWVRFSRMAERTMEKKAAWILQEVAIPSNLPFWGCSGQATYWMGAAGNTIYIDFPAANCLGSGAMTGGYVFSDFDTSGAGAPQDVILSARVRLQATLQELSGYKYPLDWCDSAMTSCKAPW